MQSAPEVLERAELIVKVKVAQPDERAMLRPGQILYIYLHLAPDREQTLDLLASGAGCIAYETAIRIRTTSITHRTVDRARFP